MAHIRTGKQGAGDKVSRAQKSPDSVRESIDELSMLVDSLVDDLTLGSESNADQQAAPQTPGATGATGEPTAAPPGPSSETAVTAADAASAPGAAVEPAALAIESTQVQQKRPGSTQVVAPEPAALEIESTQVQQKRPGSKQVVAPEPAALEIESTQVQQKPPGSKQVVAPEPAALEIESTQVQQKPPGSTQVVAPEPAALAIESTQVQEKRPGSTQGVAPEPDEFTISVSGLEQGDGESTTGTPDERRRESMKQTLDELDKLIDTSAPKPRQVEIQVAGDRGEDIQAHLDSLLTGGGAPADEQTPNVDDVGVVPQGGASAPPNAVEGEIETPPEATVKPAAVPLPLAANVETVTDSPQLDLDVDAAAQMSVTPETERQAASRVLWAFLIVLFLGAVAAATWWLYTPQRPTLGQGWEEPAPDPPVVFTKKPPKALDGSSQEQAEVDSARAAAGLNVNLDTRATSSRLPSEPKPAATTRASGPAVAARPAVTRGERTGVGSTPSTPESVGKVDAQNTAAVAKRTPKSTATARPAANVDSPPRVSTATKPPPSTGTARPAATLDGPKPSADPTPAALPQRATPEVELAGFEPVVRPSTQAEIPAPVAPVTDFDTVVKDPLPPEPKGQVVAIPTPDRAPVALERSEPELPAKSLRSGQRVEIGLRVLVDERGRVVRVVVDEGDDGSELEAAAINAVLRWRYRPGTQEGSPARVWTSERFVFESPAR